jgi:dihydroorotate dehydrogenase
VDEYEKGMYRYIRPLLFQLDPETAHSLTLGLIQLAGTLPGLKSAIRAYFSAPHVPVSAFGLKFSNPVGLAAGYDKDGIAWSGLSLLGFSHIELGTVTPQPQQGNPRPRIFRLPEDQALINCMGFPGKVADFLATNLTTQRQDKLILGVNLGKNESTPFDNAIEDYLKLIKRFASLADYLVLNISSPNTPGLRRLQARNVLDELLTLLVETRQSEEKKIGKRIPLLVKLSPDLSNEELDDAIDVVLRCGIDGVVATNTTIDRNGVNSKMASQMGGLSGKPLRARSTELVSRIYKRASDKLPIIGVGGVMNVSDAKEKIDAGAILVQVYTGLVYRGPGLVKEILRGLSN